jgi:hypothetical protein
MQSLTRSILAGNDAKAVVLDFVNPLPAGWRPMCFCGKARRDESGRQGTLQHAELIRFRGISSQIFFCRKISKHTFVCV